MSGDCHIYIIADSRSGPVKIGLAGSVSSRIKTLQTGNPRPLHLVYAVVVGSYSRAVLIESSIHKICAQHLIRGEWFEREAVEITMNYLYRPASWPKEPKSPKSKRPSPQPYTADDNRKRVAILLTLPWMERQFPTDESAAAHLEIHVERYRLYKTQWESAGRPLPQGWTKDTVESLAA